MNFAPKRKIDESLEDMPHWMKPSLNTPEDLVLEAREADLRVAGQSTAQTIEGPGSETTAPQEGGYGSKLLKWDEAGDGVPVWVDRCALN